MMIDWTNLATHKALGIVRKKSKENSSFPKTATCLEKAPTFIDVQVKNLL